VCCWIRIMTFPTVIQDTSFPRYPFNSEGLGARWPSETDKIYISSLSTWWNPMYLILRGKLAIAEYSREKPQSWGRCKHIGFSCIKLDEMLFVTVWPQGPSKKLCCRCSVHYVSIICATVSLSKQALVNASMHTCTFTCLLHENDQTQCCQAITD